MKLVKSGSVALVAGGLFFAVQGACGSGGVVGGECIVGRCVEPNGNPEGGIRLDAGDAGDTGDASDANSEERDGSGGGEPDGSDPDAGGDGSAGDGGPVCAPPHDVPSHCGDCNTQCAAPNRLCAPDGMGGFECVPMCDPPLVECGSQCVDTNIDPKHCGECFNECPSGICQAGTCVGANVGHIVLACMNYGVISQNAAQTRLLGNAVFLPVSEPVRILAYTQHAPAAGRNRVNQVITWAGAARGRTHLITNVNQFAGVTSELNITDYDVFLVYDQPSAPAGALATAGASWAASTVVDSFARAGGVVIVLSGGGGEMDELMTSAGLLTIDGEPDISGAQVYNRAPADAVGVNVVSPFLAAQSTCTFDTPATPDANTIFVFTSAPAPAAGEPVVVHRVVAP